MDLARILNQTKKLSDGSYEKIFSQNEKTEAGVNVYNCILCSVANLPGEQALKIHIAGKKHQLRLSNEFIPDVRTFKSPLTIHPAIPIPSPHIIREPRLHAETSPSSLFEYYTRKINKSLLGCEYLIELMDPKLKEPLYICTLCDKRCDPRNIIPQVTSHRHRMKYLDFHFPSLMAHLNRDRKFNNDMTYREKVLTAIADKIESQFGRQKALKVDFHDYEKNKQKITERVRKMKHFSEVDMPEWEEIFLKTQETNLEVISSDEEPTEDTLETYRVALLNATNSIELKYKKFKEFPESHQNYTEEWQAFWQRRFNQLAAQGKDTKNHDFKPEWVAFWMPRMLQLKHLEVEKAKDEIRKNLHLKKEILVKFDEEIERRKRERSASPSESPASRSRSLIEISDESEHPEGRVKRYRRARSSTSPESPKSRSTSPEGPINIVTVCRLLLALESELGIIAPRVVDLLEKALSHERVKANSSDELLKDLKNINFLDMVKEKLKGLLGAELLSRPRIAPVKKSIRNIAELLHEASKLTPAPSTSAPPQITPTDDPSQLIKSEVAKIVGKFCVDHGKTEVSDEELAGIIDECMMILNEAFVPQEKEENDMEKFTDEDLKSLLRNFTELTDEEQKHLVHFLEVLEKSNPRRVKMLSKYVDAGEKEVNDDEYEAGGYVPSRQAYNSARKVGHPNNIQLTGKGRNRKH